jgi:hypothetical protein
LVLRGRRQDGLGYDTDDFPRCAAEMAGAALSGRNAAAVAAELARVRARFGLARQG